MCTFNIHGFKCSWERIAGFTLILVTFLTGLGWAGESLKFRESRASVNRLTVERARDTLTAPSQGFPQGQYPTSALEAHLITITPDGIEPAAINSSQGHFILAYENRSGLDNLSLHLTLRESSIHQLPMPLLKTLWTGEFNLEKGVYELTESSHPDWLCTINIR